jgi:ATP-dependent helicase YprA (DUF1998 family)
LQIGQNSEAMNDNYFLNYHDLVLARITSGKTKLYPHQVEALLAIYQKACRGELDGSYRQAALILAGVGTGYALLNINNKQQQQRTYFFA